MSPHSDGDGGEVCVCVCKKSIAYFERGAFLSSPNPVA